MLRLVRSVLFVGMVAALLLTPTLGQAQGTPPTIVHLEDLWAKHPDFDARTTTVQPTTQQVGIVSQLGAAATWNKFGTPRSMIKYGGFLGTGLKGTPATAARNWINANRALFRLSEQGVANLEVVRDTQLPESAAHVVVFRQTYTTVTTIRSGIVEYDVTRGVPAVQDGMITVGIVNGRVAYVSSSAAGDGPQLGAPRLTPLQAWIAAATNIGRTLRLNQLANVRAEQDWTVFTVPGFSHPQRARLRALPMPGGDARLVYETNILHSQGGEATAYIVMVDALNGAILFRQNRVQHADGEGWTSARPVSSSGQPAPAAAPTTQNFQGDFTENGTCGPKHTFTAPAGTTSIAVVASAAVVVNDITLALVQESNGATVSTQDTGTSPEALVYTAGDILGDYSVVVCEAGNAAVRVPPTTYVGQIVFDDNETPNLYEPKWKFFPANPPLTNAQGVDPNKDTRIVGCWNVSPNGVRDPECNASVRNSASRAPWDHDVQANTSSTTTKGNNANTAEAWVSPLTPAEQYRPVSPDRRYIFPWTNQWFRERCNPAVFASPERNDIDAATTNLFVQHNRMHDWSYRLGFNERNGNAQQNNFGNTSPDRENDPETGNVQAGAVSGGAPSYLGRDNANQITLQDGIPPITNMYLWQPISAAFYAPCVDGDYDMSVIGHEYTHMISNRMVGGPDSGLTGAQAGAMGESWSDLVAVEFLNEYSLVPTADENPFSVGAYVTGNKQSGIRNYGMNSSPLNFSNIGYDIICSTDTVTSLCTTETQVHADGEIWSATNFDIRKLLIAKYDKVGYLASDKALQRDCANGKYPFEYCPGNRRWMRIVFAAWLLMPPDTSFLDARDAYLAADLMLYNGVSKIVRDNLANQGKPLTHNQRELWLGFARRGMGQQALTQGTQDPNPEPNFASPVQNNIAVTFNVIAVDEGNAPINNAKIYVGQYEARSTPIADTDGTTSRPNTANFVPGSYTFTVQAPGHGFFRFQQALSVGNGLNQTINVAMPTNWASQSKGATIVGNGGAEDRNLVALIDDTEATTYARRGTGTTTTVRDMRPAVIVSLGGSPRNVARVQVSAMQRHRNVAGQPEDPEDPGSQSRFSALRRFEILTCTATGGVTCDQTSQFSLLYRSSVNAFPGGPPRPTAPALTMRSFDVPDRTATHVMLRILDNQCTGQPAFQGEQDNDPANPTDCRYDATGATTAQARTVRAAELQVFSR